MEHLLFVVYLVLFAWLTTKVPFFRKTGLTPSQLIIAFLLKVMAGIFYGWIGVYYGEMAQMVDTWAYHYGSLQELELLRQDPVTFFSSLFTTTYDDGYARFFSTQNSYWNDLKGTFFTKINALFNLVSFSHYYTNVIFYSFLTLFGPMALFRVMKEMYPERQMAVLLATFLIPSFLYWTSGLHKDGLIFTGLALLTFQFHRLVREKSVRIGRILLILFSLLLVLALRNFLIFLVLPALFAWWLSERVNMRPIFVFGGVYLVCLLIFFTAGELYPPFDFPGAVVTKQHEFMQLQGGSEVEVRPLQPSIPSFVRNLPQALSLTLLRPFPSDVRHLLSLAAAVEVALLLLLLLLFLLYRDKTPAASPILLFCVFLSVSILLMVGYTVNFLGAIVRYRSLALPFVLVPLIAHINWKGIGALLTHNMIKRINF